MIGQTVGKYRVQDRIGRGGMGTVYLATDEMLRREVAIKVLNSELNDPEVARRFKSEAITVARLNHPGIATVYELFEHEGQWLMVMEFVRGETLEKMIEKTGPLVVERAVDLVVQALTALAHAHSMGVVHRDLKPANLIVTPAGVVKIMDFGIARVAGSEHLTAAGFMMGTPAYMAPEQVLGHEIDARADLYAMGVVLYRLTTAKLPFKGETPFALAQSQVNDPPTPVRLMRAELPVWIEQIISRSLSKAPVDRFQTADEFREALKRGLAGLPIETVPSSIVPPELLTTTAIPIGTDTSPTGLPRPPIAPFEVHQTPLGTAAAQISEAIPIASGTPPAGTREPVAGGETAAADQTVLASGALAAPVMTKRPATTATPSPTPIPASPTGTTSTTTSSTATVKRSNTMLIAIAAGVVLLLIAGGAYWYRKHFAAAATTDAGATAPPTTTSTAPAQPPAPANQPITPEIPPTVVAATPGQPTNAANTSTNPPAASTSAVPTSGTGAAATPPSTNRGAVPPTTISPGSATGRAVGPEGDAHVAYSDVKMLAVTDKKGQDVDVTLNFVAGQISLSPRRGGEAILSVPYNRLAHATYIRAKDPKWYPDPALAQPPDGLDIPGFMRGARHWLVLQTRTNYLVLRLDDSDFRQILDTVESRTGVKVDRPTAGK